MQLVTHKDQLIAGSRIAVLGEESHNSRWNRFGIVTKVENEKVYFADPETRAIQSDFLSDIGIGHYGNSGMIDPFYQTFVVSEEKMIHLQDEYRLFARQRTEANLQAAQAQADTVRRVTNSIPIGSAESLSERARLLLEL